MKGKKGKEGGIENQFGREVGTACRGAAIRCVNAAEISRYAHYVNFAPLHTRGRGDGGDFGGKLQRGYAQSFAGMLNAKAEAILRNEWEQKIAKEPGLNGCRYISAVSFDNPKVQAWHAQFAVGANLRIEGESTDRQQPKQSIAIGPLGICWCRLRTYWYLTFQTIHVTDYVLPFFAWIDAANYLDLPQLLPAARVRPCL